MLLDMGRHRACLAVQKSFRIVMLKKEKVKEYANATEDSKEQVMHTLGEEQTQDVEWWSEEDSVWWSKGKKGKKVSSKGQNKLSEGVSYLSSRKMLR